jgi:hypothetical protein
MNHFVLGETGKIVNLRPVDNLNSGATYTDVVNMKYYSHIDLVIMSSQSTVGATVQVTVEECTTAAGANNTDIAFKYRKMTTSSDTLKAAVARTAAQHLTFPASLGVICVISLDAQELSDGYNFVRLGFSDPGAATYIGAIGIMSGARYGQNQQPSALT